MSDVDGAVPGVVTRTCPSISIDTAVLTDEMSRAACLADFVRDHARPRRPVVFTALAASSTPVDTWTFAGLRARFGDVCISMADHAEVDGVAEPDIPLGPYLDALDVRAEALDRLGSPEAVTAALGPPPAYLRNIFLCDALPDLYAEVKLPFFVEHNWLSRPPLNAAVPATWARWVEIFISGQGTRYPHIHADTHQTHAWLMQVFGRKRLWLWPPRRTEQLARLYDTLYSVDVAPGEEVASALSHAPATVAELGPGDVIFIPAGWWHTVEALERSITVSGNFVDETNWDDFLAFNHFAREEADDETVLAVADAVIAAAPEVQATLLVQPPFAGPGRPDR